MISGAVSGAASEENWGWAEKACFAVPLARFYRKKMKAPHAPAVAALCERRNDMRPDYRCARLLLLIANLAFPGAIAQGAEAGTAAADASSAPTIVFVCEHGSSRSLVAATLFNRIAEQRGLAVRAI